MSCFKIFIEFGGKFIPLHALLKGTLNIASKGLTIHRFDAGEELNVN
jgi:hypothetical protein